MPGPEPRARAGREGLDRVIAIVGIVISLLWMTIWADRRRQVVAADDPAADRRVYR